MQEDYLLHSEPGDVFFGLAIGTLGAVEFTALEGQVYLSGIMDLGCEDEVAAGFERDSRRLAREALQSTHMNGERRTGFGLF
jgi:hypothetical protein